MSHKEIIILQSVWRTKHYSSVSLEEQSLYIVHTVVYEQMHIPPKNDREQNPQPSFFCTSKSISLKSKLSGTECSQQPSSQRTAGEKKEKIVTSRKADKLRITAPDAIIIMRAIELHLERSHLLGSHAGPGCVYLYRKPDGRNHPLHTSLSVLADPTGAVTSVFPDLLGEPHYQLQRTQPSLMVLCLHVLPCLPQVGA